jgi:hypothetical protein
MIGHIRLALAGILALFVASAAIAQTFPTVPSRSVIGRIGTPGTSGPSQAISFSQLASQLGLNSYLPVFNVANYGNPQQAITAARTALSGTVYFPCGTYDLGSGAVGLDLTSASAIRLTGPDNVNGGAGQCVTLTYSGTGTMIDANLAYGLEIDHLYLLSTGLGSRIIKGDNTFALYVHDNLLLNAFSDASNLGVSLDVSQGAVIERNGINMAGGIGVKGIGTSGLWSVKTTISKNTFFAGNDVAISAPGQTWTISENISQNPVTGFIRPGPAGRCDMLTVVSNDVDDVTPAKTIVQSNCGTLTSIGNRYTNAAGGTAILQDNSTGAVTSIGDRMDGAVGVAIGTGNYLSILSPDQHNLPTALYSGTPTTTNITNLSVGVSSTIGRHEFGKSGYPGQLRIWNDTATTNYVTLQAPTGAIGTVGVTLPNASGTLVTQTDNVSLSNKVLGNSNIATLRDDRFTLQDNSDTTKQAVFELSGITTATTRTYTLPNASATLLYSGGPLGTPSSGTVTNLTGTASININGTVGATTPTTGAFSTVAASSTVSGTGHISNGSLASVWSLDTSATTITIANNGTQALPAAGGGLLWLRDSTLSGASCLFILGNSLGNVVAQTGALCSNTPGGAGVVSITYAGSIPSINNKTGGSITFGVGGVKFN